ncbi:MAG: methionyl-tRNA formyltransferase [Patescibacteria group bacterium]
MKIIFFGTPEFSVPFLDALASDPEIEILAVVTQPDKPVGRKQELTPSAVKMRAEVLGILVIQFPTLKTSEAKKRLATFGADAFIVVAYGKLIPKIVLDLPQLGCINVHPSKLPQYRGPSPIQAVIEKGDRETAVSIMLLDEGMDTGPILAQKSVEVLEDDTSPTLSNRLMQIGAPLLLETLKLYASGALKPIPQDGSKATITKLLDRDSGKIDLSEPAELLERKIRAYTPWPATYTIIKHRGIDLRVKILKARLVNGTLELLVVQPEGGRIMNYDEFKRGYGSN